MALSPRRCIPLRALCRGWPPVGASHVVARKPFGKESGLNMFQRLGHRHLPRSGSHLQQYRLLSDVKPPKVNVSLSHQFRRGHWSQLMSVPTTEDEYSRRLGLARVSLYYTQCVNVGAHHRMSVSGLPHRARQLGVGNWDIVFGRNQRLGKFSRYIPN